MASVENGMGGVGLGVGRDSRVIVHVGSPRDGGKGRRAGRASRSHSHVMKIEESYEEIPRGRAYALPATLYYQYKQTIYIEHTGSATSDVESSATPGCTAGNHESSSLCRFSSFKHRPTLGPSFI